MNSSGLVWTVHHYGQFYYTQRWINTSSNLNCLELSINNFIGLCKIYRSNIEFCAMFLAFNIFQKFRWSSRIFEKPYNARIRSDVIRVENYILQFLTYQHYQFIFNFEWMTTIQLYLPLQLQLYHRNMNKTYHFSFKVNFFAFVLNWWCVDKCRSAARNCECLFRTLQINGLKYQWAASQNTNNIQSLFTIVCTLYDWQMVSFRVYTFP